MLVMGSDLIKLVSQGPHPGHAVHELKVAFLFVVYAGVVYNCVANRCVHTLRDIQRYLRIVQAPGPGILIKYPQHLARLAEDPANPVEKNGFAIGEVVEDESDRPLSRRVRPYEIALV